MTSYLQNHLLSSLPPFDGDCICNRENLGLSELLLILCETVKYRQKPYPAIQTFRDWHEHDGYIVDAAESRKW